MSIPHLHLQRKAKPNCTWSFTVYSCFDDLRSLKYKEREREFLEKKLTKPAISPFWAPIIPQGMPILLCFWAASSKEWDFWLLVLIFPNNSHDYRQLLLFCIKLSLALVSIHNMWQMHRKFAVWNESVGQGQGYRKGIRERWRAVRFSCSLLLMKYHFVHQPSRSIPTV